MKNRDDIDATVKLFTDHPALDANELQSRLQKIMKLAGAEADEVSLAVVDDTQISNYNRFYLNREGPTDVLAFPYNEITEEGKYNLGDIVISVETAESQALEMGHSLHHEMDVLMIHAVLHLLGYDHEKDKGEMEQKQNEYLNLLHNLPTEND